MIHSALNFVFGSAATLGTATGLENIDPGTFGSLDELIKYIISIAGGILATFIINLLKKKFPDLFTKKSKQEN